MPIEDVLTRLENIDKDLNDNNGLKWFNKLYLLVTEAVYNAPATEWESADWITRLDEVFAELYFRAIEDFENGKPVPKSWSVFLECRFDEGIDRIQFALAGMNAHINRDLAFALYAANEEYSVPLGDSSPEYRDFERVNVILDAVFPNALCFLHTGVLGMTAELSGLTGRLLAMWSVKKARESAWRNWELCSVTPEPAKSVLIQLNDDYTGVIGKLLLAPIGEIV